MAATMSTEHATTDAAVAGTLLVLWGSHLRRPLWINRIYILWSEWRGGRNNSTLRGRHVWKPPFLCRINSLLSCTRVREPQAAAVTEAPQLKVHNFAPWSISYDDHDDGPNERERHERSKMRTHDINEGGSIGIIGCN